MQEMKQPRSSLEEQPEDPLELIVENLYKIKQEVVGDKEKYQNIGQPPQSTQRVIEQYQPQVDQLDIISKEYEDFTAGLPANFPNMSYDQKISYLLADRQTGSLMYLFELIFYFREALPQDSLVRIAEAIAEGLDPEDEVHLRCSLELLALVGVVDEQLLESVSRMMLEEQIPFDLGFLYLCNMGYPGLFTLIDIANKDFNEIPLLILDHLSRCESVLKDIVIPALLSDLTSSNTDHRRRVVSVAVLGRLNNLLTDQKALSLLCRMLSDGTMDRGLLAAAVRASGELGEEMLLKLLTAAGNNKVKLPIISVLPWKVPEDLQMQVEVVEYSIGAGFPPGVMYNYQGSLEPQAYKDANSNEQDHLLINSRDFMAALHRMLSQKFQMGQHQQPIRKSELNSRYLFLLVDLIKSRKQDQPSSISEEVIKALSHCLSNPIVQIRQASLNALGVIGLPDALPTLDRVTRCLSDADSRNRSMACWTLSKLFEDKDNPSPKIIKRMVELLKDSYWKVRTSACIALGTIIKEPNELVIQALVRALNDGSINKNTVCQTMIHMGPIGEQILVEVLKSTHKSDFKLKSAIISSFRFADITQPSIDFLIEQLFKHCSDDNVQVRSLCLETLNHLRVKSLDQNITYLKAKNILPLFYFFLQDPSAKLRQISVDAILSFGSHAELIFIEGLTKAPNPLVRIESVKALAKMGVQNFRAIIFGLRDSDDRVRRATAQAILNNFNKNDIIKEFKKRDNQIPQLICHLRDLVAGYTLPQGLKTMFEEVLVEFDRGKRTNYIKTANNENEDYTNVEEGY